MDVYDRIDTLLAERHLSRRKFAQQIDLAPSTFQSMMARKRGLTFDLLMKISEQLRVSANEFYCQEEPDREYEDLCNTLDEAGLSIEATGFGDGPDEGGDHYYVWHTGSEDPEADRAELAYRDLLRIVAEAQKSADLRRIDYLRKRLDAELF